MKQSSAFALVTYARDIDPAIALGSAMLSVTASSGQLTALADNLNQLVHRLNRTLQSRRRRDGDTFVCWFKV